MITTVGTAAKKATLEMVSVILSIILNLVEDTMVEIATKIGHIAGRVTVLQMVNVILTIVMMQRSKVIS